MNSGEFLIELPETKKMRRQWALKTGLVLVIFGSIIGLTASLFNPMMVIAVIAGAGIFLIVLMDMRIGFSMLALSLPLTQAIPLPILANVARSGPKQGIFMTTDDVIIAVLIIAWVLELLMKKKTLKRINPLSNSISLFFLVLLLSTLVGAIHLNAVEAASSLLHLVKWFEYMLVYFIVFHNIRTVEEGRLYLGLLTVSAVILALGSSWLILKGEYIDPFSSGIEPSLKIGTAGLWGLGGDKTQLAVFMSFFIMIAFVKFFNEKSAGEPAAIRSARGGGQSGRKVDRLGRKFFYISTGLLFLFTFLFTLSRASYLGLIFGAVMVFSMLKKKIQALTTAAVLFLIAFFLIITVPNPIYERISGTFNPEGSDYKVLGVEVDPSSGTRPVAWKYGVEMFTEKPLLGWGYYNLHFLGPLTWGGAENQYLTILAEGGLLGFLSLLWLYYRLNNELLTSFRTSNCVFTRELSLALIGGFWVILTVGMFAEIFAQWRIAGTFFFLTAIATALANCEKHEATLCPEK